MLPPYGVLLLLLFLAPFLAALLYLQVVTLSFTRLGITPGAAVALLLAIALGSGVNIPVSRRRVRLAEPLLPWPWGAFFFFYPPRVQEQVIAVNVGGAIIPAALALYLLGRAPLVPTAVATVVVAVVTHRLARPVRGLGIRVPALIPPVVAALAGVLLGGQEAPVVAYIAGVVGTLVGADLLNLGRLRETGGYVVSVGGAGIYDGILLVGVVAALLG